MPCEGMPNEYCWELNLYTLGRLCKLCKEWCYTKGYPVYSLQGGFGVAYIIGLEENKFIEPTELEATIKTTEWVKDNLRDL